MIYAVHKRTKEHRVISDATRYGAEEWRYVDADPDGWIEWPGGECPLPDDCFVQIKTNIGIPNEGRADEFRWARQSRHGDIVAYRPILDAAEPEPPAWDGAGMPRSGALACTSGGECEVVTTDGARGQVCVRWNDGELGVVPIGAVKPRPIRSEEDRAVDDLMRIYQENESVSVRDAMRDIYRAGYRKTGDT